MNDILLWCQARGETSSDREPHLHPNLTGFGAPLTTLKGGGDTLKRPSERSTGSGVCACWVLKEIIPSGPSGE